MNEFTLWSTLTAPAEFIDEGREVLDESNDECPLWVLIPLLITELALTNEVPLLLGRIWLAL